VPDVLRTPEECFTDLPGYAFEPHYLHVEAEGLEPVRMHYLDEGPADGPVALLLHGQPTWSYLYRTVVPVLVAAGVRVIAPDNIGYGRSDKPAVHTDNTFARRPGLGRPDRPQRPGRGAGPVRPRRGGQHDPAHRRPRSGRPAHLGGARRR
jgi:pimeloyl-ACP methyl ester carboxylesterase